MLQTSPASVIFPSPLTSSQGDRKSTFSSAEKPLGSKADTTITNNHMHEGRFNSNRRRFGRAMTPITSTSASANKVPGLHPSSKVRGQNPKSSVYIGNINHQQNYIPSLEYYAKGPLLSMPEQGSCRTSADEALTGRKLGPLEPPDRVSAI